MERYDLQVCGLCRDYILQKECHNSLGYDVTNEIEKQWRRYWPDCWEYARIITETFSDSRPCETCGKPYKGRRWYVVISIPTKVAK